MQHATLVQLGVKWLSRQCPVVLYEAAAVRKEIPDVIGWAGPRAVLIECKASRADFTRDAAKVTRADPRLGMAHRRYYLCPAGVIQVADLPAKWGLLWADKGKVTVVREARGFPQRNLLAEVEYLSAMLRRAQIRIGDAAVVGVVARGEPVGGTAGDDSECERAGGGRWARVSVGRVELDECI